MEVPGSQPLLCTTQQSQQFETTNNKPGSHHEDEKEGMAMSFQAALESSKNSQSKLVKPRGSVFENNA
jgi:hypothetical protein